MLLLMKRDTVFTSISETKVHAVDAGREEELVHNAIAIALGCS